MPIGPSTKNEALADVLATIPLRPDLPGLSRLELDAIIEAASRLEEMSHADNEGDPIPHDEYKDS